eukprot:SM000183S03993  [mRNA]  locus=s183:284396:289670:- [translate_table: standard]
MAAEDNVPQLVRQLVGCLWRDGGGGGNAAAERRAAESFCLRVAGSLLGASLELTEAGAAEAVRRRLAKAKRTEDVAKFDRLVSKLSAGSGPGAIQRRAALLHLLLRISEQASNEHVSSDGGDPLWSYAKHFTSATAHSISSDSDTITSNSKNVRNLPGDSLPAKVERRRPAPEDTLKAMEIAKIITWKNFMHKLGWQDGVLEEDLVSGVLYACQGIDSKYIAYDAQAEVYKVKDDVQVPKIHKKMVEELGEAGCLYQKLRLDVLEKLEKGQVDADGHVWQGFCQVVHEEIKEYYSLLAKLAQQALLPIPSPMSDSTPEAVSELLDADEKGGPTDPLSYLTLRRLYCWLGEPLRKMRLLCELVSVCKGLKGGAMIGKVYERSRPGIREEHELMTHIFQGCCSSYLSILRKWILEGNLTDSQEEMFIVQSSDFKEERLWSSGFRLNEAMLPTFISRSMALKILRCGKSINFLKRCCNDGGWMEAADGAVASLGIEDVKIAYGKTEALELMVEKVSSQIDQYLLKVMLDKYKFMEHCGAFKRYFLLGQGEFIQCLMDTLAPELSKPASTVSMFDLSGILESAKRSSSAQYHDAEHLDRLNIHSLDMLGSDDGWAIFKLEYNLEIPLTALFTHASVQGYQTAFRFLWHLKRVESSVYAAWTLLKASSRLARQEREKELARILRQSEFLRSEMNNFMTNLQYYVMLEVVETSWASFLSNVQAGKCLDDYLRALQAFLAAVLAKAFIGRDSSLLKSLLMRTLECILRFHEFVASLHTSLQESHEKREVAAQEMARRSAAGRWGSTEEELAYHSLPASVLRKFSIELQALAAEFSSLLEGFLSQLAITKPVNVQYLLFRLDFSGYYSRTLTLSPAV